MKRQTGISFFQRYLTIWVLACMVIGVLLGHFAPSIALFLNRFEYANVSIPMAALIWVMIYPMMLKVDFQSIRGIGKNPKGLFVTWVTNWLIKPFTMYGIASLFFFTLFKLEVIFVLILRIRKLGLQKVKVPKSYMSKKW